MNDAPLYIFGKMPVLEYLQNHSEKINKVYIREDTKPQIFGEIKSLCKQNDVQVVAVPVKRMNKMADKGANHQGVIAQISPISYGDLTTWLNTIDLSKNPTIVILDSIEDPHNFGAILRTASASGVDAVLIGKRDQCPVTGTVIKTSAGTADRLPILRVNNLNQAIRELKDKGFWITGTEMNTEKNYWDVDFKHPNGILIGNEGRGTRPSALALCDEKVFIPMQNDVESLNASVSAALLMYEIKRQNS